jgi:hypothetical protein
MVDSTAMRVYRTAGSRPLLWDMEDPRVAEDRDSGEVRAER